MNAERIAKRFAKARREGRTWRFACPLCGKPKAWARDHSGKTHVGCFACDGDWREIRAAGGLDPGERSAPVHRADVGKAPLSDPARALKSWRLSGPIKGSPVEAYLARRGLELPTHAERSLSYCASLWHWPTHTSWPAMVALVGDAGGREIAAHQTFLARNCSSKAPLDRPRLFPAGARLAGFGVWLGDLPADELIVAEGVESCLAAMLLYGAAAGCAALSAPGLAALILPAWAKRVRVCADHDLHGRGLVAAHAAYRRWREEGRAVVVSMPNAIGDDMNDVLMRRQGLR